MGRKGRAPAEIPAQASPAARAAAAVLCAAVAGAVLSFSILFDGAFTAVKLAWTALLAAAGAWLVFLGALNGSLPPRRAPLDLALGALFAAAALSTAFSIDRPLSVLGHQGFYTYGLLAGAVFLGLYLASSRGGAAERPRGVLRAVAYSAGAAGLLGLLQWGGVPTFAALDFPLPQGRVYSTLGSPVYLGTLLALAAPVCARLAVPADGDPVAGKAALLAVLAAAVLTQSRACWLGVLTGLGVWAWASGRLARASLPTLKAAAAVLGLAALLAVGAWTRRSARADSARLELWKSSLAVAAQRPLTGVGTAAFENAFIRVKTEGFIRALGAHADQASAHNELLQVASTMGLPGLAAYLACLWAALLAARRALADPLRLEDAAAGAAGLVGLLVNTAFEPLPFAVAAPAAVLLGSLGPPATGTAPRRASAALRLGAALLCTAAAWGAWRLAGADFWFKAGKTALAAGRPDRAGRALRRALELNPYETKFRAEAVKFLIESAGRASGAERALALAEEARLVSAQGVALRPGHAASWRTHGSLLVLLARGGTPALWPPAASVLDRALELEPWFPPLLEQRAVAAEAMGDARTLALLEARRTRLAELARP